MPREPIWNHTDHGNDKLWIRRLNKECFFQPDACLAAVSAAGIVHLTREALADLVRAAAPLAGLTVVDGEPSPEVDGEPGLDPEDRAAAVAAVWGGRCKGESTGWLWSSTVDVAHYIATGEVPA